MNPFGLPIGTHIHIGTIFVYGECNHPTIIQMSFRCSFGSGILYARNSEILSKNFESNLFKTEF